MKKTGLLCLLILSLSAEADFARAGTNTDEVLVASPKGDITRSDFEAEISRIPESDRVEFLMDQKRIDKTLDSMLINRWLATEAREMGLDRDPVLKRRLELDAEKQLARARVEKLEKDASLPDAEKRIRELYLANKDKYVLPLTLRAFHILVDFKTRSKEEALARAKDLRQQILSGDKSFEELALANSDDPSAKHNKGDLGYFSEGRMVKPFWEAASALKTPGETSDLVETQFGYHIIRLADRKERRERSFEEMKPSIQAELQADYVKKISAEYANKIRAHEKVKADSEAISRLNPKNDPKFPAFPKK